MVTVGITGQSGTGKTTVSGIFRSCGFMHIDTDKISREVMKSGTPCFGEIVDFFGAGVVNEKGELNRAKIAEIVFDDEEKLEVLNSITHKYILNRVEHLRDSFSRGRCRGIVVDGAALIESGYSEECDYLIAVVADDKIQSNRIQRRDFITEETAQKRIDAQKDDAFYAETADFVIENNSDLKSLQSITEAIIFQITEGGF